MKHTVFFLAGSALLVLGSASASASELIVNGSFELGNVGFTSGYTFSPGNVLNQSTYDINRNPNNDNQFYASYGDHTTGSGLMMVVNGSSVPGLKVWSETVVVAPGANYNFSFFGSSCYPLSPAELDIQFNDASVGTFTLPLSAGVWQNFTAPWNSGASTSLTIDIIDRNLNFSGNDFALDDISLQGPSPVSEPTSIALLGIGAAGLIGYARRRNRGHKVHLPAPGTARRVGAAGRFK